MSNNQNDKINLNYKNVEILKRQKIKKNNTHDNIVDISIKNASLWKIDSKKNKCAIFLYIITFGILYIIQTFYYPGIFISLNCVPSFIDDAQYILIINKNDEKIIIKLKRESLNYSQNQKQKNQQIELNEIKEIEKFPSNQINLLDQNDNINNEIKLENSLYFFRNEIISNEEKNRRNGLKSIIQKNKLNECITFMYLNNKYRYDNIEGIFYPVAFYLNRYKKKELNEFKNGIPNENILNYLQNFYIKNQINLKSDELYKIIINEIFHLNYIYIMIIILIWLINKEYNIIIVNLIFLIILIILSVIKKNSNQKLLNNVEYSKVTVIRNGKETIINSNQIVPGDAIILKNKNNFIKKLLKKPLIVPCDGIILEGYCTVNESDLTGENSVILRKEISLNENNINEENFLFDYHRDKSSFLFQGSKIFSLYSQFQKKEMLIMLATNTGYNTYRGNMISNWICKVQKREKLDYDKIILSIIIILLWISNIYIIFLKYKYELLDENKKEFYNEIKEKIYNSSFEIANLKKLCFWKKIFFSIKNLSILFPPTLIFCINFGRFHFRKKLEDKNISCMIDKKIDIAGRVEIIILDKTGTLTENNLNIHCYKSTKIDENGDIIIGNEELEPLSLNKIYKQFWKKIYNLKLKAQIENKKMDFSYQNNYLYNIIYFTECLASCHNIYKINNKNFGTTLDIKLFNEINWEIIQEIEDIKSPMFIQPHNSYKITENLIFENNIINNNINNINNNNIDENNNNNNENLNNNNNFINNNNNEYFSPNSIKKSKKIEKNFYLKYLTRFEFLSEFQSMSVVVENSIDKSIRVYSKGAPEKIIKICLSETIPIDLSEQLQNYTKRGFRVLACASKKIEKFNKKMTQEFLEKDLIFLGLIVIQNKIKKDTKMIIKNLKDAKIKLIISTGDNAFTTMSVAQQSEIIEKDANIFRIESSEKEEKPYLIIIHNINIKNNNNENYFNINNNINSINNSNNTNLIENDYQNSENYSKKDIFKEKDFNIFHEKIKEIIKDKTSELCISGSAFTLILERINEFSKRKDQNIKSKRYIKNLKKLLRLKGKIFYRMLPDIKSNLVNFFRENGNKIVGMCGDGANDSSAFIQSDLGVAINQVNRENNLISHYYSKNDSISCLEFIIKDGRAYFENKINTIKVILVDSIIELCSNVFLYLNYQSFNVHQNFFSNIFYILLPSIIACRTDSKIILSSIKSPKSMFNNNFIFGVVGQIFVHLSGIIIFGLMIKKNTIFWEFDVLPKDDNYILTTYVYIFTLFQYIIIFFIFNGNNNVHKTTIYSNNYLMFYLAIITFFSIIFITVKNSSTFGLNLLRFEIDQENFELKLEENKFLTIISIIIVGILSMIINFINNKIFK